MSLSPSGWPQGRAVDGGIDEIPVPGVAGRLWLCGKHAVGPDPDRLVARVEATFIVCLTERHELIDRYPHYVEWLSSRVPHGALWLPIPDLGAPPLAVFADLVEGVTGHLAAGHSVVTHCAAGIGRAGTLAVAVLMRQAMSRDDALVEVARHRPMAGPEAGAQQRLLAEWETYLGGLRAASPD
jgi:hypothetical protein